MYFRFPALAPSIKSPVLKEGAFNTCGSFSPGDPGRASSNPGSNLSYDLGSTQSGPSMDLLGLFLRLKRNALKTPPNQTIWAADLSGLRGEPGRRRAGGPVFRRMFRRSGVEGVVNP